VQQMMDRALRERIIGAVVLVVFAILVVPIFLNGPSRESEIITESVTLPGQNNQERQQQTIVLERDRTEPVPNAGSSTAATQNVAKPVQKPPLQVAKKETEKKAEDSDSPAAAEVKQAPAAKPASTEPAPTAESSTGMWAVQLGSFSNQQNAERLAADLRNQGYAAFLSQLQTGSGALQRVRIGPQKDRESAEEVAEQLGKGGHKGQVVPHP
jgi:DedD protein